MREALDELKKVEWKINLISEAKQTYLDGKHARLSQESLEVKIKDVLVRGLFSGKWLDNWCRILDDCNIDRNYYHSLKDRAQEILSSFHLPAFPGLDIPSNTRIAISAAVGAFLGITLLSSSLWRGSIFVGAPIGAFLLVWGSLALSRMKSSVPGIGSVIKSVRQNILGVHTVKTCKTEKLLDNLLPAWVDLLVYDILLQIILRKHQTVPPQTRALHDLVAKIQALNTTSKEDLPAAVEELVQTAQILGFEIGEAPKTFRWAQEHSEQYDTYGHIEPGDEVLVKRPPVILQGKVEKKGLVIKRRRG